MRVLATSRLSLTLKKIIPAGIKESRKKHARYGVCICRAKHPVKVHVWAGTQEYVFQRDHEGPTLHTNYRTITPTLSS